MRYVYVDEAGTSAREPVTVVVGVVIDADNHWKAARDRIESLFDKFVPTDRRKNFIFHAKQIWGDKKIRAGWPDQDRFSLLNGMMNVPFDLGLAISIGVVRRDPNCFAALPDNGAAFAGKVTPSQWEHFLAFSYCLEEADRYIRTYGHENEVGTVVAENIPELARFFGSVLPVARQTGRTIPIEHIRPTVEERRTGTIKQNREVRVERLVDTVHFVDKKSAPLLQIADACAFAMRRWHSGQLGGLEFARSVAVEHALVAEDWAGKVSMGLYYWHPRRSDPQQR